jgi:hypothetical protein
MVVLGVAYFWIYFGDITTALAWDIVHRRTATFRGQSLKLPWLWKEEQWTNYNEFRMTDYGSRTLTTFVTVEFGHFDPSVMHERLLQMRSRPVGWTSEDYPGDESTRTHYRCVRNGFRSSELSIVDCFSLDGRWAAHLVGPPESDSDFQKILREVAGMGDPAT